MNISDRFMVTAFREGKSPSMSLYVGKSATVNDFVSFLLSAPTDGQILRLRVIFESPLRASFLLFST